MQRESVVKDDKVDEIIKEVKESLIMLADHPSSERDIIDDKQESRKGHMSL
jgi:hypothetical protein